MHRANSNFAFWNFMAWDHCSPEYFPPLVAGIHGGKTFGHGGLTVYQFFLVFADWLGSELI